jgi:hypothetical protein
MVIKHWSRHHHDCEKYDPIAVKHIVYTIALMSSTRISQSLQATFAEVSRNYYNGLKVFKISICLSHRWSGSSVEKMTVTAWMHEAPLP